MSAPPRIPRKNRTVRFNLGFADNITSDMPLPPATAAIAPEDTAKSSAATPPDAFPCVIPIRPISVIFTTLESTCILHACTMRQDTSEISWKDLPLDLRDYIRMNFAGLEWFVYWYPGTSRWMPFNPGPIPTHVATLFLRAVSSIHFEEHITPEEAHLRNERYINIVQQHLQRHEAEVDNTAAGTELTDPRRESDAVLLFCIRVRARLVSPPMQTVQLIFLNLQQEKMRFDVRFTPPFLTWPQLSSHMRMYCQENSVNLEVYVHPANEAACFKIFSVLPVPPSQKHITFRAVCLPAEPIARALGRAFSSLYDGQPVTEDENEQFSGHILYIAARTALLAAMRRQSVLSGTNVAMPDDPESLPIIAQRLWSNPRPNPGPMLGTTTMHRLQHRDMRALADAAVERAFIAERIEHFAARVEDLLGCFEPSSFITAFKRLVACCAFEARAAVNRTQQQQAACEELGRVHMTLVQLLRELVELGSPDYMPFRCPISCLVIWSPPPVSKPAVYVPVDGLSIPRSNVNAQDNILHMAGFGRPSGVYLIRYFLQPRGIYIASRGHQGLRILSTAWTRNLELVGVVLANI
ncbi:hypothetical protein BKA62DRAFT_675158 [Auriculariales sp. MPI-PUGE-AT-0066]|nr:hypothetical protein BKA62DRAFT_675158 [Auriculariales sp. MPI-PUGE-AT-0066]